MTISLLQLRRIVVSMLIAAWVAAPLAQGAGATSLVSVRAVEDGESAESSRSVGLMTGAESGTVTLNETGQVEISRSVGLMTGARPGTVSLNEAGAVEVSRSVGLMTGASGDDSPLQASGAGVLEISRSVGLMEGAPGGAYGVTIDQSVR